MAPKVPIPVRALGKKMRAIVGIESAIVLIAFVVVAAALAFVVLNMGFFTTQRSKETIGSGLSEASSAVEIDGTIVAGVNVTAKQVDYVYIPIRLSAGKGSVDVTPGKASVAIWSTTKGFSYSDIYVLALSKRIAANITNPGWDSCGQYKAGDTNSTSVVMAGQTILRLLIINWSKHYTICVYDKDGSYAYKNLSITYNDYIRIAQNQSDTGDTRLPPATYTNPEILKFIAENIANFTSRSVAIIAWVSNQNSDNVIDPGEKVLLFIYLYESDKLSQYHTLKVELRIPIGAPLTVERMMPASLTQSIVDLG